METSNYFCDDPVVDDDEPNENALLFELEVLEGGGKPKAAGVGALVLLLLAVVDEGAPNDVAPNADVVFGAPKGDAVFEDVLLPRLNVKVGCFFCSPLL